MNKKKETETLKDRSIVLKLSDSDCKSIFDLCGEYNISVANLLENFIYDMIGGSWTNGSDERDLARQYFERCWFGMFPEKTLLNYLLSGWNLVNIEEFMCLLEQLECLEHDLKEIEQNPNEDWNEEEVEFLKNDIESCEKELLDIKVDFKKINKKANWEEEVEKVKKFIEEREKFCR